MAESPFLGLPYMEGGQASKHVTHNEALRILDVLTQIGVISSSLNDPPSNPVVGDRYIVGITPTGAWADKTRQIAVWATDVWMFYPPRRGYIAYNIATATAIVWNGFNWGPLVSGGGGGGLVDGDYGDIIVTDDGQVLSVDPTTVVKTNGAQNIGGTKTFTDGVTFLGATQFRDNTFQIMDETDVTKRAFLDATGIPTGTDRTYSFPGETSGTFVLDNQDNTSVGVGASTDKTVNIANGASASGITKTINIGRNGLSGSTTNIEIGSAVAGALGNLRIASANVEFLSSVSTVAMTAANLSVLRIGIGGATADATNRFSINSPAALFNHDGTSMSVAINKAALADNASLRFQTDFVTRAEIGLLGGNDFGLRVTFNGTVVHDVFSVYRDTGRMTFNKELGVASLTATPASPVNGLIWYDTALNKFRAYQNGAAVDVIGGGGGAADPLDLTVTNPVAPSTGILRIHRREIAGRQFPVMRDSQLQPTPLQPHIGHNRISRWNPPGYGSTALPGVDGLAALVTTNMTLTARAFNPANYLGRQRRLGFVTAVTAGTVGHFRGSTANVTMPDGAGNGGFYLVIPFCISDAAAVAGARMFMGIRENLAPANAEPSGLTNCIGIGHGASDTTFRMYCNGPGTFNNVDLGANFPCNTRSVDWYELRLFAPNRTAGPIVFYEVERMNTGDIATGSFGGALGTQFPLATLALTAPWGYRTNNATALAIGLDVGPVYLEVTAN